MRSVHKFPSSVPHLPFSLARLGHWNALNLIGGAAGTSAKRTKLSIFIGRFPGCATPHFRLTLDRERSRTQSSATVGRQARAVGRLPRKGNKLTLSRTQDI